MYLHVFTSVYTHAQIHMCIHILSRCMYLCVVHIHVGGIDKWSSVCMMLCIGRVKCTGECFYLHVSVYVHTHACMSVEKLTLGAFLSYSLPSLNMKLVDSDRLAVQRPQRSACLSTRT